MKLQYLGTAAAEGIPGIFCDCDTCTEARRREGRNFRTRSQALVDDSLLLDFPADTLMHCHMHGVNLARIQHCLITHTHGDHLYLDDLEMRIPGYSSLGKEAPFTFYGLDGAMRVINGFINGRTPDAKGIIEVRPLTLYETTSIGDFQVTALKALHDSISFPAFYLIGDKEGKQLLYAHDTDYFCDEVWDYLEKSSVRLDFVSLDCTAANNAGRCAGHMNFRENVAVRNRLMELGCADADTIFCSNHFSHNAKEVLYETFSAMAEAEGFLTSFDGMTIQF